MLFSYNSSNFPLAESTLKQMGAGSFPLKGLAVDESGHFLALPPGDGWKTFCTFPSLLTPPESTSVVTERSVEWLTIFFVSSLMRLRVDWRVGAMW